MLTRSANASPVIHGFHYAPSTASPRNSHSWNPTAATSSSAAAAAAAFTARRLSSSSLSGPCFSPRVSGAPAASPSASDRSSARSSASVPSSPALSRAPSLSHHHGPSHGLASLQPSTPLAAARAAPQHPAHPGPRSPPRYVAVDAATQYSPMESFDYAAAPRPQRQPTSPTHAPDASSKQSTPREIPPVHGPVPMEPGIEQGADHAAAAAATNGAPAMQGGRPAPGGARATTASAAAASSAPPNTSSSGQPQPHATSASPQKRRIAREDTDPAGEGAASASARRLPSPSVADSPPGTAKRARAEAAPGKLLPELYEFCAVEDMVVLIANMLGELIETNDSLALKSGHLTRFHSRTPPGISVLDYLHRLAKHATLTPPLLLSMVYYIDRLCAMYPDFTINTLTVHRFLITAATVAAKGLSDSFWNNSTYARVGGVRVAELKMLELEFLYRLEWKIVPNPEVLAAYYRPLVERCPGYALPPDCSPSRDDYDDMADDDEDDDDDEAGANGSAVPPKNGHNRQSSTSLIGEDLVASGLTRRPSR